MMPKFQPALLLTAAVLLVILNTSARSSGTAMFNSGHEPDADNLNSEALVGIAHPSRVGRRQGERLSDQRFCFGLSMVRPESKGENEKYETGVRGRPTRTGAERVRSRAGISESKSGNHAQNCMCVRVLGARSARSCRPAAAAEQQAPNLQLSYGNDQIAADTDPKNYPPEAPSTAAAKRSCRPEKTSAQSLSNDPQTCADGRAHGRCHSKDHAAARPDLRGSQAPLGLPIPEQQTRALKSVMACRMTPARLFLQSNTSSLALDPLQAIAAVLQGGCNRPERVGA